ncbi:MAG: DUF4034 domain-containing protein [Betaproteobacteria bacterium]|nr:DUF4034 domain-containing protein [Betaproteobacteria bacterium]
MKQLLFTAPLLLILSTPVLGNDLSKLRYPWDMRPASCPMGDATEPKECALTHFSTRAEARQKVLLLYYTEQFHLLERALEDLSQRGAPSKGWSPLSANVYAGLYDAMTRRNIPLERQEPRLKRWREANPNSLHLPVAEAILLGRRAWQARGGGYAHTVTPESWAVFEELHAKAERILLAAPPEARNRPGWHDARHAAVINLNSPQASQEEVFEEAIKKFPNYHLLYMRQAQRLIPKWGGSWRALESFASKYTEETDAMDGGGLYARIYMYVGLDEPFKEMGIDWKKLKVSFEKLLALIDPDPYTRNQFASFACAARDEATFIKVFESIKPHDLRPADWLRGHSPDACKLWAFKNA